jgi:hypothetical protein
MKKTIHFASANFVDENIKYRRIPPKKTTAVGGRLD